MTNPVVDSYVTCGAVRCAAGVQHGKIAEERFVSTAKRLLPRLTAIGTAAEIAVVIFLALTKTFPVPSPSTLGRTSSSSSSGPALLLGAIAEVVPGDFSWEKHRPGNVWRYGQSWNPKIPGPIKRRRKVPSL